MRTRVRTGSFLPMWVMCPFPMTLRTVSLPRERPCQRTLDSCSERVQGPSRPPCRPRPAATGLSGCGRKLFTRKGTCCAMGGQCRRGCSCWGGAAAVAACQVPQSLWRHSQPWPACRGRYPWLAGQCLPLRLISRDRQSHHPRRCDSIPHRWEGDADNAARGCGNEGGEGAFRSEGRQEQGVIWEGGGQRRGKVRTSPSPPGVGPALPCPPSGAAPRHSAASPSLLAPKPSSGCGHWSDENTHLRPPLLFQNHTMTQHSS